MVDLNEARIRAAAHLSVARMHLDIAEQAVLEEAGSVDALAHVSDARRDIDHLADEIMAPLGLDEVLATVEESMEAGIGPAGAMTGVEVTVGLAGRRAIITAMVQAREAGAQDESRHALELVSSFLHSGLHAACACGWTGPTRYDAQEAHIDYDQHRALAQDDGP